MMAPPDLDCATKMRPDCSAGLMNEPALSFVTMCATVLDSVEGKLAEGGADTLFVVAAQPLIRSAPAALATPTVPTIRRREA